MIFIGDYFAIGLVIVLSLFYFDNKYYLTKASKYFVACLILTAMTALTDLLTGSLLHAENVPLWLNMAANSLYFLVNIVTTSFIALFLFTKILEHSHNNHCMTYAVRGLWILFVIYAVFIILNLWTGWLFFFDAQGNYHRGSLNSLGYIVTVCQMVLVMICYFRNRKNASKPMRRALIQTFPVVIMCILIQRAFPEIMLNGYIMSMVDAVLFLTFQGQRMGVHTLTKLSDRHRFFRDVETRLSAKESMQIFLINVRNFGSVNQKYGHMLGDEVLYQFAFSLEALIRKNSAYHMNGTKFALIFPYNTQKDAQNNGDVLLDFMDNGISCMNEQICFEYTVTEYVVDQSCVKAEEIYEQLEYANDLAFEQNCRYIRYTPEINRRMEREQYLTERLQCVDREHGFRVWYQPICCLSTGKFCSMEALVRLKEPDGSLVNPGEFIALAEKTGIITAVTWFVLEETCEFLVKHPELDGVSVSVNLPISQLLEKGFVSRLNSIVDHFGIEHRRICLEFTERELPDTFEQTKAVMEQLTVSGYRFYLDDFGTGYSNFSCMLQLPLQFIKLDSSLVKAAEPIPEEGGFLRAIVNLSHDMGYLVVAEGVETLEEVEQLSGLGVDRIQGYAFAKPMQRAELLEFYEKNPVC